LTIYAWPFFVNRLTIYVGKISYSVYLLHFLVLNAMGVVLEHIDAYPGHYITRFVWDQPLGLAAVFLVAFGISLPLCTLSRNLIELPGMDLGRQLIAHKEKRYQLDPEPIPAQP
jgi:peptidoglycan/LPS O-acetylase OafA/YrhL